MFRPENYRRKLLSDCINKGFTLAEVLITLVVIGVIAALTIPNLLTAIQDEELHTAWRKNYSDISAAFSRAKMDKGGTLLGACEDDDNDCLRNIVMPYLSYVKSCDKSKTDGTNQCFYDTMTKLNYYSGNITSTNWTASALQLSNGSLIFFAAANPACDRIFSSSNIRACGQYKIDVNGFREPNTVGRDVYSGWVMPYGTLPVGALDQNNALATTYNGLSCDKSNPTAQGWGCSVKFITQ